MAPGGQMPQGATWNPEPTKPLNVMEKTEGGDFL